MDIRNASHLWGGDTYETDPILKSETHEKVVVSAIGQAGENQVLLASIMTDGRDARAAGRCGMGAVMGSKNLKAIVVYGSQTVPVSDPDRVHHLPKEFGGRIIKHAENFRKYGTAGSLSMFEAMGTLPFQNWKFVGRWEESAEKINGVTMSETVLTGRYFCDACMLGCGRRVKVVKWYHLVTGREMTLEDFLITGERIFNLKRLYNVRLGISRKDDTLPFRHLTFKRIGKGLTPNLPPLVRCSANIMNTVAGRKKGFPPPRN